MQAVVTRPFDSIESAREFMLVLETVIAEASIELQRLCDETTDARRAEAVHLALYKISQLEIHTHKSCRILNDLGLLRALLLGR
jgi:hypothetical protein